jgi:phosphodiesterase/alkaline phosphatase D-like protein
MVLLTVTPTLAQMPGPVNDIREGEIAVATEDATSITESSATLNGYLESAGPYSTLTVWFELSNGQSTSRQVMSSPGIFSAHVAGLTMGTPYQFRAMAASTLMGGQKSEGAFVSFTTRHAVPQAPIAISTSSASDVTSNSATLRGYVSGMGPYDSVSVWFQWGTSTGYGSDTEQQVIYGPGPFSIQLSGLAPNTSYYFRAAARPEVVGVTTVYGNAGNFNTSGAAVIAVSTGAEMGVTNNSATITGYLQSLGSYRNASVWFEWGPTAAYGQTTGMQTLYSPGTFNYTLQGLNPGTTYHFRALAVPTAAGGMTIHGFDSIFTTTFSPGLKVSTSAAGNVGAQSAALNGFLTSMGSSAVVNVWFEYGTDTTFGSSTPQQTLNMPGNFSYNISRLLPGITYYYRAAAFSNGYNVYGQYSTFQTTSASPVSISTNPASNISTNAATLNAYVNSLGSVRSVQVIFNFGQTPQYGSVTSPTTVTYPGTVSFQITGISPGTQYYYQAVAQTPDNLKVYGSGNVFSSVSNSSLSVATSPASAITSSSAILNGFLQDRGSSTTVQAWFEYGSTADMGNSSEIQTVNDTGAYYSTVITGLAPGRTYYYRSVALNPTGGGRSVNGSISSFVTGGSGPAPAPVPGVPTFVWLIIGGFVIVIIIVIILLSSRR